MVDASVDCLRAELALLAAGFVLPGLGPDVNRAIRVACDLLAQQMLRLTSTLDNPGQAADDMAHRLLSTPPDNWVDSFG